MDTERFIQEESGATAIEYGLIASLLFLVIIGSVTSVADGTVNMWQVIRTHLQ